MANQVSHTAVQRPGVQFGVGGQFQAAGVPQVGLIAGPEYLVTISPDGEIDKFDPNLASRQIAWIADMIKRLDGVSAEALRQGDPTLGSPDPVQLALRTKRAEHPGRLRPTGTRAPPRAEHQPDQRPGVARKRELSGMVETNIAGVVHLQATFIASAPGAGYHQPAKDRPGSRWAAASATGSGSPSITRRTPYCATGNDSGSSWSLGST